MGDFGMVRDRWVCPNDRELSLRAKLKTGWSVKTNSINSFNKPEQLSDAEQEAIMNVIKRAENLEKVEQERVGRLVDRLDNMKKNAMGNGSTQCVLCAEEFGILGQSQLCKDCEKAVCSKCGVETLSAHKEPLFLCRICAETRETWKKSGAWFYRGLPKYILPIRKTEPSKYSSTPTTPLRTQEQNVGSPIRSYNPILQAKGRSGSDKEYIDSSDEEFRSSRFSKRGTIRKHYAESAENSDPSPAVGQLMPQADPSQGPSPTHMYSPVCPESPQNRDMSALEQNRAHEGFSPYSRDAKKMDEERIPTPTSSSASHWYKPNIRTQPPEQEDYPERTHRGHVRKESQHPQVNRHRSPATNRNEENFEEKVASPEESSKKRRFFNKKKKRKK